MDGHFLYNKENPVLYGKHGQTLFLGVEKILKECDYICNVLPKSLETDNILGNGMLELCKGNTTFMVSLCMSNHG